jgi:hypothetical protein
VAQAGLSSSRVIYVECGDDRTVLACFEEGPRHKGLGAVIAEVARLPMTASRRLQLAAESSGTIGIAIRRWRRQTEAADFGQPTAVLTRWRVTVLPSEALPVPGIRGARWQVELIRCRAGESADFVVEACDAKGLSRRWQRSIPARIARAARRARLRWCHTRGRSPMPCGPYGVCANAVAPAWVRTPMSEFEMQLAAEKNNSTTDAEFEATTKRIALGRMAQPSEIAACCLFLASDEASFVTGAVLDAVGGGRAPVQSRGASPARSSGRPSDC